MATLWTKLGGLLHNGISLYACDVCPCPDDSSSFGSSFGSSSVVSDSCTSSTCVTVDCCPGVLIPQTLTCTITGGTCAGSFSLTWDGTAWRGANGTIAVDISCSGSPAGWYLQVDSDAQSPTVISCDPLEITYDFYGTLCGDITVTITE